MKNQKKILFMNGSDRTAATKRKKCACNNGEGMID